MRKGPADEGGVGRGPEAGGLGGRGGNSRRRGVRVLPSRGSGPEGVLDLRFQQGAFSRSSRPGAVLLHHECVLEQAAQVLFRVLVRTAEGDTYARLFSKFLR